MTSTTPSRWTWALAGGYLAALVWAYWTTLAELTRRWSVEPMYSHGYLVPAFAALLLYLKREKMDLSRWSPSWWGVLVVAAAMAARAAAAFYSVHSPDRFSLLVAVAGMVLAVGGWAALRWAWPAVAFLLFMIPLPAGMDTLLTRPLQRFATLASANVLQTLGFVAEPEGNVILLQHGELGVEEACSGLRMFMTFCALTVAIAMLAERSWVQKGLILLSAFPLAMVCNVARISGTGVVHETLGEEAARVLFHDLAGWLMIGLAGVLLVTELWVLAYLFPRVKDELPRTGKTWGVAAASRRPPTSVPTKS